MFQRRRRPIDYHWIAPPGRLTRACSPHLLCILRSGRTLLFLSCRAQLPPPVCQMEVPRPPWSNPRLRARSYLMATVCGASAVSPRAWVRDMPSYTKQTATGSEIQIVCIPARYLSFPRKRAETRQPGVATRAHRPSGVAKTGSGTPHRDYSERPLCADTFEKVENRGAPKI